MTDFIVVIPARRKSTRLSDKPLADIHGKPMVVRVAERALASGAKTVYVATDDAEIAAACAAHGMNALMTHADHPSGTDRLAEVAAQLELSDETIVVNVQGDEPLIEPQLITAVAARLAEAGTASIATASHAIASHADYMSPNVVKVVVDCEGIAQYFSRAPIPFYRDHRDDLQAFAAQRHVGIYAYRAGFLHRYASLAPASSELAESLEQLRAMHHGYRIAVLEWHGKVAPGVDTPEDLARVRALWV